VLIVTCTNASYTHISHLHPLLYRAAVAYFRLRRAAAWLADDLRGQTSASTQSTNPLPVRVKRHQSRLIRRLGDSEMWLQYNKVQNLALAIEPLAGLLIRPGETFSFWRRVGKPSAARGYIEGMEISRGEARAGIGGGICQIANVLHWLVLHSPLVVVERSTHSYDPFPDNQRSIPYGTGCSVFYNYIDLRFSNPTDATFQLCLKLTDRFLEGDLRADRELAETYSVCERNHAFIECEGRYFRRNELYRRVFDRSTGVFLREEPIKSNFVRVKYVPAENILES